MDNFNSVLVSIQKAAVNILPVVVKKISSSGNGGYLCVIDSTEGKLFPSNPPLFIARVGDILLESEAKKYYDDCQERAIRLAHYYQHVSSFQSRDEEEDRSGGAIKAGNLIISFAGFDEEMADELFVLRIAVASGLINHYRSEDIAKISGNKYFCLDPQTA